LIRRKAVRLGKEIDLRPQRISAARIPGQELPVRPPFLSPLTAAWKTVKTLQKLNNQRHEKQLPFSTRQANISARAGLVEYSYVSVAVNGAPDLIVKRLSSTRRLTGPHAPGGCKSTR
jgi:hypothetical protein